MTLRAAIGCRWSNEDGGANSIADQERMGREDCLRNGWEVAGVFVANGHSGKSMFRPDIAGITELIERDAVDIIWYKDSDRFTRNDRATEQWFEDVLEPANDRRESKGLPRIQVHFRYGVNGDEQIDPNAWYFRKMLRIQGEKYRRDLVVKVRAAMDFKQSAGYWMGKLPYGVKRALDERGEAIPSQKGIPVKDPATWPHLEWIFEQAAAGETLTAIATRLNSLGVTGNAGGKWHPTNIGRILRHRFYLAQRQDGTPLLHSCTIDQQVWDEANARIRPAGHTGQVWLLDQLAVSSHYQLDGQPMRLKGVKESRCRPAYVPLTRLHNAGERRRRWIGRVTEEPQAPRRFNAAVYETRIMEYVLDKIDRSGNLGLFAQAETELDLARETKVGEAAELRRQLEMGQSGAAKAEARLQRGLDSGLTPATLKGLEDNLLAVRAQQSRLQRELEDLEDQLATWPTMPQLETRLGMVNIVREYWNLGDIATCNTLLRCFIGFIDLRRDGIRIGFRIDLAPKTGKAQLVVGSGTATPRGALRL